MNRYAIKLKDGRIIYVDADNQQDAERQASDIEKYGDGADTVEEVALAE